jgi:hypothetical protein
MGLCLMQLFANCSRVMKQNTWGRSEHGEGNPIQIISSFLKLKFIFHFIYCKFSECTLQYTKVPLRVREPPSE